MRVLNHSRLCFLAGHTLVVLIVFVVVTMAADRASASCGDYLHTPTADTNDGQDMPRPPCKGSHCSGGVALTMTIPSLRLERLSVDLIQVDSRIHADDGIARGVWNTFVSSCASMFPRSVFRPPIYA